MTARYPADSAPSAGAPSSAELGIPDELADLEGARAHLEVRLRFASRVLELNLCASSVMTGREMTTALGVSGRIPVAEGRNVAMSEVAGPQCTRAHRQLVNRHAGTGHRYRWGGPGGPGVHVPSEGRPHAAQNDLEPLDSPRKGRHASHHDKCRARGTWARRPAVMRWTPLDSYTATLTGSSGLSQDHKRNSDLLSILTSPHPCPLSLREVSTPTQPEGKGR